MTVLNLPKRFYSEFKKYANMTVEEYFNLVWAKQ
mgnify:CR=1 FL=1